MKAHRERVASIERWDPRALALTGVPAALVADSFSSPIRTLFVTLRAYPLVGPVDDDVFERRGQGVDGLAVPEQAPVTESSRRTTLSGLGIHA
jgi:hypothetical protein